MAMGVDMPVIGDVERNLGSSDPERQASRFRGSVCQAGGGSVSDLKAPEFKPERK